MWPNQCERPPRVLRPSNRDRTRSTADERRHHEILVKKQIPNWLLLTCSMVLLASLLSLGQPVAAKTHHSKRQAAAEQQPASPQTGRESTNWWNLWWQQYINEASQPTVRPIVSVSFNGRTINLSPSGEQADLALSSNNLLPSAAANPNRDLETNFVPNNNQPEQSADQDIERNERMRLIASNLPDNAHPFAAKQMMLAQRKSNQQQSNWQSVKPTIIQMSPRSEPARSNRQAAVFQTAYPASEAELGIQMRTSMNRGNSRVWHAQQQGVGSNMIQQQLPMDESSRFEQQQNQMVDYSEETEPELDNSTNTGTSDGDQGRVKTNKDSSTSSMMMVEPQTDPTRQRDMVTQQQASDRAQAGQPVIDRQPAASGSPADQRGAQAEAGRAQQPSGAAKQPPRVSTPARGQQQQVSRAPPTRASSTASGTSTATPEVQTSTLPSATTTTTSTTSVDDSTSRTSLERQQATSTSSEQPAEFTETPISLPADNGQTRGPTGSPGRVELENGRPATSGNRQQGTTNAARPASKSGGTTPSRGSATPSSSSSTTNDSSMRPSTGGQKNQQSFQKSTMTSPAMASTPPTPSGSPQVTRQRFETSSPSTSTQSTQAERGSRPAGTTKKAPQADLEPTTRQPAFSRSTPTSDNRTETSTASTGANATEPAESSEDSDSADSETDEDGTDNQSGSMVNSSDNESDLDDTDAEDNTSDKADEDFTTTTSPVNRGTTKQQLQQVSVTTQQPSLTTIDIERLPKSSSPSPIQAMNMMRGSTPSASQPAASSSASGQQNDLARLRQQEEASMMMMNLGEPNRMSTGNMEGDNMAITLPMDTLVRMMMGQMRSVSSSSSSSRPTEDERPITSTLSPIEQTTTTTTQQPTRASSTVSQQTSRKTSEPDSAEPTTQQPEAAQPGAGSTEESQSGAMPTTGKKRLQPPPTTRSPASRQSSTSAQSSSMMTIPAQTSFIQEGSSSSPSGAGSQDTVAPSSAPKMMIVNLDSQAGGTGSSADEGSPVGAGGGREPKIELLNLDLMPIQRIMNSQQMKPFMRMNIEADGAQANTQPKQAAEQQQSTSSKTKNNNQAQQNETRREPSTGQTEFVLEVEPGMRLRPVSMGSKTSSQQAPSRGSVNANQANTVYMIMMDTATPSKTTSKSKQMTVVAMSSTSAPLDQRTQTKAHQQFEPLTTTVQPAPTSAGSRPSKTNSDRTSAGTSQQPQRPFTGADRTVSAQSSTTRTAPVPSTVQQTGTSSRGPQRATSMGASADLQRQQTTPLPGSITTTSSLNKPKLIMMDNAIEMEQPDKDMVPTMREIEMSLDRGQQRQMNALAGGVSQGDLDFMSKTSAEPKGGFSQPGAEQQQTPTTTIRPSAGSSAEATTPPSSATDTTLISQTTTTQSAPTSSQRSQASMDQRQQPATTTTVRLDNQLGSTERATTVGTSFGSSNNQPAGQLERLQQGGQERPQRPPASSATKSFSSSKIGKPTNGNLTSSFIPTKLRSDFNKFNRVQPQQQQQSDQLRLVEDPRANPNATSSVLAPTTQSPTMVGMMQNMAALRQFGGANRMSALANQPVPFGRPSMGQSARSSGRIELPSFEYGPSIAVRRPDEPLANGQIPNCTLTGKNFCVLTKDYPMNEVRQAVERSFRSVRIMYEELQTVSDQELHKDDFNATNNQAASGKFACQTQVEMMRPGWAKDEITKEWMLVVNTDVFPQRVRTESCAQPNTPCEFIAPFYDSTCQQRYSLHRMIAIDPHDPSRSPQVAVFKFPAGCVCRVHPIRKTTTSAPFTIISSSTSKSIRRRR